MSVVLDAHGVTRRERIENANNFLASNELAQRKNKRPDPLEGVAATIDALRRVGDGTKNSLS